MAAPDRTHALSPAEALKTFQLEAGLRIELVAAEPLVVAPVAFAFDEQGRLYVVENRGYPDVTSGGTTLGRVALLTDTDGDGRYDKRTEFATGLGYVNGITVWRGGVFVSASPDILYLKDTNGDGIADERRVVLTGFDASKNTQLRASHPTLGRDGKVYITSGLVGGKVTSPVHSERVPVTFTPRDGRFDPDTFEFENTGGRGQFGLAFDAFGRRFICSNRRPVLEVMLEPWHLRRNPNFAFGETVQEVSQIEAEAKVFPISHATVTADFTPALLATPHVGTFTSACGLVVFGGTGLTPEHVGDGFICEPAQNLIQRQKFRDEGASRRSEPPHKGTEFLASTDTWFRPVFLSNGPDGALYVADMYRREIDHPQFVPEEVRNTFDFEAGKNCGRIYRIVSEAHGASRRSHQDATATGERTVASLVAGLESREVWQRDCSHRLLIESRDQTAIPLLDRMVVKGEQPEARALAIWTLRGMHGLSSATITTALGDASPRVREQAVNIAVDVLNDPAVRKAILALADDSDARVRFCVALVLGAAEDPAVASALAAIASRDGEDQWTRVAVLSGIGRRTSEFLTTLGAMETRNSKALGAVMMDVGRMVGAAESPDVCRAFLKQTLRAASDPDWRFSAVVGLVEGLQGRKGVDQSRDPFADLHGHDDPALEALFYSAIKSGGDDGRPISERVGAIALLGYTDIERASPVLGRVMDATQPPAVQLQGVRTIEHLADPRLGALLVAKERWGRYTPQIRQAIFTVLIAKTSLTETLLSAIEHGVVQPTEVPPMQRMQLMKHADPTVRRNAAAVFQRFESGDRMKVYQAYRDTLTLTGDVESGRAVFGRICSACHTFRGSGGRVGPDLTGIRNQPAEAILLHILVPNYEVAPSYQAISIVTTDGRSLSGWLVAESEGSLTLRTAFDTSETVLRKDLTSITASGLSLMPDGLEQTMSKAELANLIAFLKSSD